MIIKPGRGIQLNRAHPLARGLVGCWLFNEGTGNKVFDLSLNGNEGTINNGSWSSLGGLGILCDSDNDAIETGLGMSGGTIVAGLTVNGANPLYRYIFMGATTTELYLIQAGAGGAFTEGTWRFNLSGIRVDSAIYNLTIGEDYQIVIEWPVRKVWINNDLIINTTSQVSTITELNVGGNPDNVDRYTNANIHYVYAYNRVLTASEVRQLYINPYAMFDPRISPAIFGTLVAAGGLSIPIAMRYYRNKRTI